MKANSNYIINVPSLLIISGGKLLARYEFYIPAFKSKLPGILSMTFHSGFCFIVRGMVHFMMDALSSNTQRKNPNYFTLLPDPGCKQLINEFAGKSSWRWDNKIFFSNNLCDTANSKIIALCQNR